MANINDFKGIPPITWSFIVAMMISTIIPGLLLVFLFREDLFMTVETVKLLFLSMGITMPGRIRGSLIRSAFRNNVIIRDKSYFNHICHDRRGRNRERVSTT